MIAYIIHIYNKKTQYLLNMSYNSSLLCNLIEQLTYKSSVLVDCEQGGIIITLSPENNYIVSDYLNKKYVFTKDEVPNLINWCGMIRSLMLYEYYSHNYNNIPSYTQPSICMH